jgi:hypothetical protein
MADGIARCRPSRFSSKIEFQPTTRRLIFSAIDYCEFQRREKASCADQQPLCAKAAKPIYEFFFRLSVEGTGLGERGQLPQGFFGDRLPSHAQEKECQEEVG